MIKIQLPPPVAPVNPQPYFTHNKFKKIQITRIMFLDHHGIKLEINNSVAVALA